MTQLPLLHTGSVKDIYGNLNKKPYVFKYSDRYSVFDWGEMPDGLEDKGKCLAAMANFFFEVLGENKTWENWNPSIQMTDKQKSLLDTLTKTGLKHHGLGLVDEQDNITDRFTDSYAVRPMNIVRPEFMAQEKRYDYGHYDSTLVETLVPLEVIFRFDITEGSSLLKRVNDQNYLDSMGITKKPAPGDHYDHPLIEFSTKLESTDRYITLSEAKEISHTTEEEIRELKDLTLLTALRLKDVFSQIGIELHDGKFEFAFATDKEGKRTFQLIDSIGPDELRLSYKGVQLSKECLRHFYRGSDWHNKVEESKKMAQERGTPEWKDICIQELKSTPPALSNEYKDSVGMMYKTITDSLYKSFFNKEVFSDCWDMDTLIKKMPGN